MLKPKNVIDREDKGEIVEAEGGGTMTKVYCTAIVLAAGSGKRMGTKVHKQYLQLCAKAGTCVFPAGIPTIRP